MPYEKTEEIDRKKGSLELDKGVSGSSIKMGSILIRR